MASVSGSNSTATPKRSTTRRNRFLADGEHVPPAARIEHEHARGWRQPSSIDTESRAQHLADAGLQCCCQHRTPINRAPMHSMRPSREITPTGGRPAGTGWLSGRGPRTLALILRRGAVALSKRGRAGLLPRVPALDGRDGVLPSVAGHVVQGVCAAPPPFRGRRPGPAWRRCRTAGRYRRRGAVMGTEVTVR